jgi:DNA-binding transcriptional LysR family regulator
MFDARIISGITVFATIVETGGFAAAAPVVGLTRSGVSRSISRLQDRIGIRLFDGNGRAARVTAEGLKFYDEIVPILKQMETAIVRKPDDDSAIRGRLRICCDAAFATYLLVPRMNTFLLRHPKLEIDILVRDHCPDLSMHGYDAAIRFGGPDPRLIEKSLLIESRIVLCASPDFVAMHGMPHDPDEFATNYPCVRLMDDIVGRPHLWEFKHFDGRKRRISPNATLTLNDAPSIMAAVKAGIGAARLLDFMVQPALDAGELIELVPEWNHQTWPAYIWLRDGSEMSVGLSRLVAYVRDELLFASEV